MFGTYVVGAEGLTLRINTRGQHGYDYGAGMDTVDFRFDAVATGELMLDTTGGIIRTQSIANPLNGSPSPDEWSLSQSLNNGQYGYINMINHICRGGVKLFSFPDYNSGPSEEGAPYGYHWAFMFYDDINGATPDYSKSGYGFYPTENNLIGVSETGKTAVILTVTNDVVFDNSKPISIFPDGSRIVTTRFIATSSA